jgi:outer membrane immunogenic protein
MMRFLSGFAGVTLASAIAIVSANAADMYRAPEGVGGYKDGPVYVAPWAGFYVGVNGGYGWSPDDKDITLYNEGKVFHVPGHTSDGGFGGGQIGYNWQPLSGGGYKDGPVLGNFVFGVEADIQGSGIGDNYTARIREFNDFANVKADLDYFGTVRGRVGYAVDATLLYFTGGFAYGGINTAVSNPTGTLKNNETLTGYVLGGGIEHKFTPSLSFKVEYQYIDLGDYRLTEGVGSANQASSGNIDANFHTIRVGLNYYIGSIYEPLK